MSSIILNHHIINITIALLLLMMNTLPPIASLPQGAPTKVCNTMLPFHGGGIPPQTDIAPFQIKPYHQNGIVTVVIESNLGVPFQGFMMQGRTPTGDILGVFEPTENDAHTIDCADDGDTLTHNDADKKNGLQVAWRPPIDYDGPIIFNATVAQSYNTFWLGIESKPIQVGKRAAINNDDPIPDFNNNNRYRPSPVTPPNFNGPAAAAGESTAIDFDPFYDQCTVTKLCFGAPAGCIKSKSCKAAVAIAVNGDKYDIEMRASANSNAAWIAMGLSEDAKMGDDSVVECAKRGTGVGAYMSWTSGPPNSYGVTRLSNPQLGIQLLNGSVIDDVLYCRVRRDARTTVRGKVFDLVNDKYNLLIAAGSSVQPTSVAFHDIIFLASGEQQSLSDVSALAAASKLLIRLHGSFMLAAWIGTASLGILLARYYKQTWVGSTICGKDLWFAWHRTFMILTWALTVTGFILIFVELRAWSGESNPHAILGTITTIVCFFQPIGAYFRPHPGTPKRQIFNWLHWLGGNVAHIIAIVTIFFAVKLTKADLPEFVDWILVAFVAFHVVVHLILSIMGCVSERTSERRVTSFPMKDLGGSGRSSAYTDRNGDAPYTGLRKFLLAIYIVIVLGLVVALIVITALAPIEESWNSLRNSVKSS